jgi:hypothetical protein
MTRASLINLKGKKRSAYEQDGDLSEIEEVLKDYWDTSRTLETKSIEDLEKYLWLANAAAVAISIGYIEKSHSPSFFQYFGAWSFVVGIMMLVLMKYVSAYISSRDRRRFQEAKSKFDADELSDIVFKEIRDNRHFMLQKLYLRLQQGSGGGILSRLCFYAPWCMMGHQ